METILQTVARRIRWSLAQSNITESVDLFRPIEANSTIHYLETGLTSFNEYQARIGVTYPLEGLSVNVIGAIFVGKCLNTSKAWKAYKEFGGVEFLEYLEIGIPHWFAKLIDLPFEVANDLLWLHSAKRNLTAIQIAEEIDRGSFKAMV